MNDDTQSRRISTDSDIKPFGVIGSDGLIQQNVDKKPNAFTALSQSEIDQVAKSIAIVSGDDVVGYAKKLDRGDLILRVTDNGEKRVFSGTPYEILSDIVRNKLNFDKLTQISLSNSIGEYVAHGAQQSLEFIIYHSTGTILRSVKNSTYVFECEFKDKPTSYYDIYYVLSRPTNTELRGMKKLSLVRRGGAKTTDQSCENIFSVAGILDIESALKNWHKRSPAYETHAQEQSDKEIESIKDLFIAVNDILTTTVDESEEPETTEDATEDADRTEEIREYAISEHIDLLRFFINDGQKERALKYLDVLSFIIKK